MLTNSLYALFNFLESDYITDYQLEQVINLSKKKSIFIHYFEYYISLRLRENITIKQLTNLIDNIQKHSSLNILNEIINSQIIHYVLYDEFGYEYLNHLWISNFKEHENILLSLAKELGSLNVNVALVIINEIDKQTALDKISLIIPILELRGINKTLLNIELLERLTNLERFNLLNKLLEISPVTFSRCLYGIACSSFANDFSNYLHEMFLLENDNNLFVKALRTSRVSIIDLSLSSYFHQIINTNIDLIPNTVSHLYDRAKNENCLDFLITLGKSKNKKDLLKDIMASNNDVLINRFFTIYGNDPEVKHLVTFL